MKEKPVFPLLVSMALPMVISMLVNSLYNIVDSFFVAQISEDAMTALSLVYPVQNFVNAVAIGFGIGLNAVISYYLGAGDKKAAGCAATQGLALTMLHAVILTIGSLLVIERFLRMFSSSETVIDLGVRYSRIIFLFTIAIMANLYFEKVFQAVGRMKVTMTGMMVGCIVNIILDPLLIFGIGPFPALKVTGAAIATIIAQMVVTLLFLFFASQDQILFHHIHLLQAPDSKKASEILQLGFPSCLQSLVFTGISMTIARLVAGYGDAAVAVQKVGAQIESISWMTSDGFASAVNSFIAQNHGAGKEDRIHAGYRSALKIVLPWGLFCTILLVCFPTPIFKIFITEPDVIPMGISYLIILGFSQLFTSLEITTSGAFCGYGRTLPPSITGITLNLLRIPMALALTATPLALSGIWWSISITSILKGLILFIWFQITIKKK